MDYGFVKDVKLSYQEAIDCVKAALKEQGFGVLAEIDVANALKEKLGIEVPKYLILGACNPHLAHRALGIEPHIGLLLPCNVVVREREGGAEVSVIDATKMLGFVGNAELAPVAEEANQRLRRALDAV